MKTPYFFILSIILFMGCNHTNQQYRPESHPLPEPQPSPSHVQRVDTAGLMILYPDFTSIDLVCDTLPSKNDQNVILFAEAAYTGELLDVFKHLNIAGDHVSSGKRYKGYHCARNTGAFVYSAGKWQFCGAGYSAAMDQAAQHGGCAFAQELMIHDGAILPTGRADGDKNQFRALCNHGGRLCIIETDSVVLFGDFKQTLLRIGVTDAIYLDMGAGWNHAWYRDGDRVVELHPKGHDYCTNWITFYHR